MRREYSQETARAITPGQAALRCIRGPGAGLSRLLTSLSVHGLNLPPKAIKAQKHTKP